LVILQFIGLVTAKSDPRFIPRFNYDHKERAGAFAQEMGKMIKAIYTPVGFQQPSYIYPEGHPVYKMARLQHAYSQGYINRYNIIDRPSGSCIFCENKQSLNVSTTPSRQWGFRQCFLAEQH
jgi:hypothetical protein